MNNVFENIFSFMLTWRESKSVGQKKTFLLCSDIINVWYFSKIVAHKNEEIKIHVF